MGRITRHRMKAALASGLLASVVGGCSSAPPHAAAQRGGTLRLALPGTPASIDPLQVQDASGTAVDELIYDGLVRVSPGLRPVPDLARSWHVSSDGRTYTFHLDPRAHWPDGQRVSPKDVAFSFSAYRNPADKSPASALLAEVTSVVSVGKDAVRVTLQRPYAPFLLQAAALPILPSHLLAHYRPGQQLLSAPALGTRAVGSGPFELQSQTGGQYVLTANRRYFGGAPHLSRVVLTAAASPNAALMLLRQGKLDFAETPPVDAHAVSTWPGVRIARVDQLAFAGIVWNVRLAPFSDVALRRALYFAVDRKQIVDGPFYGYAHIANGPLPPASWAYDSQLSARDYLPKTALSLLAAAGYAPRGGLLRDARGAALKLQILAPQGAPDRTAALGLVVRDLSAIGVEATVLYEPFTKYVQDYVAGNFQAAFAVRGLSADPDIAAYFGSEAVSTAGFNPGGYQDSAVDSALLRERSAVQQRERAAALRDAQAAMQVDPPELFLYFPQSAYAIARRFAGFTPDPAVLFYSPQNWALRSSH